MNKIAIGTLAGLWAIAAVALAITTMCGAAYAAVAIPICTATDLQEFPVIYGDVIAWADWRDAATTGADIYTFDLWTGQETRICGAAHDQYLPDIWGDTVVWMDERNSPSATVADIYSYNLTTKTEASVSVNADDKWTPRIYSGRVVWSEHISGYNWDIKSRVLPSGTVQAICSAADGQYFPSISGNVIVWEDDRNLTSTLGDIYSYNLTTGIETPICTNAGDQLFPSIDGNIIAWEDYRNDPDIPDIYMYNLATHTETPVCTADGGQWEPTVCGNYIVWSDDRNGDFDIYGYDLTTHQVFPIVTGPGDQLNPRIYGNKVVYQVGVDSGDIYMTFIEPASYTTVTTPNDAKGYADQTALKLTGGIVTASFGGFFYVEAANRSSGMMIKWPVAMTLGKQVDVSGLTSSRNSERYIDAMKVDEGNTVGVPKPLSMTIKSLGGGELNGNTPGVYQGIGLHDTGLLVRTAGKVASVGANYFTMTDGSTGADGAIEVKVLCPSGTTLPDPDDYVGVTGCCSTWVDTGAHVQRAIRARSQSDITPYPTP